MYRLLIVDDEFYEREGLRKQLQWEKFGIDQVDVAENGVAALKLFYSEAYDIVISDVKMAVMDGLSMALEMRKLSPDVKLLFLSGYNDFVYVKQAIQLKAYDYLLKPVETVELERKIEEIIDDITNNAKKQEQEQSRLEESTRQKRVLSDVIFSCFHQKEWAELAKMLYDLGAFRESDFLAVYIAFASASTRKRTATMALEKRLNQANVYYLLGGNEEAQLLLIAVDSEKRNAETLAMINELCGDDAQLSWCSKTFRVESDLSQAFAKWDDLCINPLLDHFRCKQKQSVLFLKPVFEIVRQRYAENLTVKEIANELHYSPNYLSMVFKREVGYGFSEYLMRVRMEEAKKLLREQKWKIYAVAVAVGYTDVAAFISRFKLYAGVTPNQYRMDFAGGEHETENDKKEV